MTRKDVTFLSGNLKLAGHLYVPDGASKSKLPAIVAVHPFGGVKEQTTGVYAEKLSDELGYITLAFDRRHQGSSEGEPRQLEDGYGMLEDIKSAVTYLSTLDHVDPARIGVLGFREIPKPTLEGILVQAGQARIDYARGGEVQYLPIVPTKEEITKDTTNLMSEASDYYLTSRGGYETSINRTAVWSYDQLANFDAFAYLDWIAPRPVLLIAGSKADTLHFSEDAYKKCKEPKELYLIEGATHIELFDHGVPKVLPKLKVSQYHNLL
ncbi:hypothetical protein KI688_006565 [Linnemannia hyalina]|uniref:Alpha/beta hydrolase n=1 Tax=Linnemannia hyalina TaxID=64524 RepID=A0A9P7XLC9_9FUNG|nr:hypothetical protein KI688_006565 [Linnemannia hyalina]